MWNRYPFRKGEICCHKTSPSFVDSIAELLLPLVCGVPLVLIPEPAAKDPNELVNYLAATKASRIVLVPSLLQSILQIKSLAELLPNLKLWVVSGEPLTKAIYKSFREAMGPVCLLNLYGSSEVSADATSMETSHIEKGENIPIGRPIANTQVYVLDSDGQPAPIDVTGELYISGTPLARGYLDSPDLTAERFIPNPHSTEPGGRMYKTGDLCKRRDDGALEFVSRNDDQVKIRGHRIELGEIAARLEEHEKVKEATVVVREDRPGDKRLVAYYTCRNGGHNQGEANVEAQQLRDYVHAILPEFMVPAAYVRVERLPLTPNGKLDRRCLPKPGSDAYGTQTYEAPIGETEILLAQIWAEVLSLEKVGRRDNFFQLGGHSLLAVILIEKMKRNGFEGNVHTLFAMPTIAQLAETEMQEVRL
jgi:arthrofactin-type cyclic lipopeptide synthetase C